MKSFYKKLKEYAELAIKVGVNIQPGQKLYLTAPIESAEFARLLTKEAFSAGASDVFVEWQDEITTHIRFKEAELSVFESFPKWIADGKKGFAEENTAFLTILANDPELMKDIDPKKMSTYMKAATTALKEYREYTMSSKVAWSIVSIPTEAWAKKVFNNDPNSVDKLWDAIFKVVRIDQENPIKAWEDHLLVLKKSKDFLNNLNLKSLRFVSECTDLVVELPEKHYWQGGGKNNAKETFFVANIPTEEVFTLPKLDGVNGTVKSTKPLNYMGNLITDMTFTFKDGEVVDFNAKEGYENLKEMLETDEGSKRLGEVALVPFHSPISELDIIFFNTLFDENASCHLALGRAYPTSIIGGPEMDEKTLKAEGANYSMIHVDFMIGAEDTQIMGILPDGTEIQIFKDGDWAI